MNDAYLEIKMEKEEWFAYTPEKRKELMTKLGALNHPIAQYIYEALVHHEKEHAKLNTFDLDETYKHYYGEEEEVENGGA